MAYRTMNHNNFQENIKWNFYKFHFKAEAYKFKYCYPFLLKNLTPIAQYYIAQIFF